MKKGRKNQTLANVSTRISKVTRFARALKINFYFELYTCFFEPIHHRLDTVFNKSSIGSILHPSALWKGIHQRTFSMPIEFLIIVVEYQYNVNGEQQSHVQCRTKLESCNSGLRDHLQNHDIDPPPHELLLRKVQRRRFMTEIRGLPCGHQLCMFSSIKLR